MQYLQEAGFEIHVLLPLISLGFVMPKLFKSGVNERDI